MFSDMKQLVEISVDTSNCVSFASFFSGCSSLETLPQINTSNGNEFTYFCANCTNLKNVPVLDIRNSFGTGGIMGLFNNCPSLTNDSLNNIMQSLVNASVSTLKNIGFSETQAQTCTTLSNWQALADAGWITGY